MAELTSGIAGKVLGILASSAYEEIKEAWGVRDDLEKVRRTMASIQAVLLDAEEKQVHNRAITLWLDQLKSILYDTEDILADYQAQHLRTKVLGLTGYSFPKKVILQVIKCANDKDLGNMDIDQLQRELRSILCGKRYLLVLDDIWEEDERKWLDLKALLMGGADGSKVIVTTRSSKISSIDRTIGSPYKVEELPHEDCLKLFYRCAFGEGEQCQWSIILRKIGEEIVTKCKGVPLAVMTLGSLLRFKNDETKWKSVRDSEIWKLKQKENDIMPALRLSYEWLPSHLKSCFACCSIFPKNYDFTNFYMTAIWMSLDLLKPSSNGGQGLEDVGGSYYNELASRGFFQDVEDKIIFTSCKMHDLIHDIALSVVGDELFNIASNSNSKELFSPQRI